jgi:uncharacterized membrane protein YbhN (UPF0104 family)
MDTGRSVQATPVQPSARRRLLWWGRATVTLGLAIYLLWRLKDQLGSIQIHLSHPAYLGFGVLVAVLGVLLSTQLWRLFIPNYRSIPFYHLLSHYLLGMLLNNFLPGGFGGDAARVVALNRATGETDFAVSSVLMTRIASLWSIVLMASAAGVLFTIYQVSNISIQLLVISSCALVITILITLFLFGSPASALLKHLPSHWGSWWMRLREYQASPALLATSLVYALGIQVCAIFINSFTARALGLSIAAWQLWLCLPMITLVTMLPISLGGFGVREGSYILLFGFTGVPAADALILSLAVYVLLTLVTAIGAGISIMFSPSPRSLLQNRIRKNENPDL